MINFSIKIKRAIKLFNSAIETAYKVKNIKDKNFYNTIRAIKNFAQNIGSEVIAEFVEDEEILKLIKELNIEYSQGYYFSAPKLIKEFYGGI